MTIINLNDSVKVTLTVFGAEIYNKYMSAFDHPNSKYNFDPVNEGYVLRTQLWCLMQIFGEHLRIGFGLVPFEGLNMQLLDDNLSVSQPTKRPANTPDMQSWLV